MEGVLAPRRGLGYPGAMARSGPWTSDELAAVPRLGWVAAPSPVERLERLGSELGLAWLGVKRDDRLDGLLGGTKVRKLDALLATAPWAEAEVLASVGAIGSGHLVALAAAAEVRGQRLHAYTFWGEPTADALENLAYTASRAEKLRYVHGRVGLALRWPRLLLGQRTSAAVVVPPGATAPAGLLGIVLGGLELADQVAAGVCPAPDVVYVPAGTAGTTVGLAWGLALGGLRPEIRAIAAVEWPLTGQWAIRSGLAQTRAALASTRDPGGVEPAPISLVHGFVGGGYGRSSQAGTQAMERVAAEGLELEPAYGAKTMAALCAEAPARAGQRVLFWSTRRGRPAPAEPGWQDALPRALRARIDGGRGPTRRRLLLAGLGGTVAVCGGLRLSGARVLEGWDGEVLAPWEAAVVAAAAEALLDGPGPSAAEVAHNVDRYLLGMPAPMLQEIHGLVALLEHGAVISGFLGRFTHLDPGDRLVFLDRLRALPEPVRSAYRGIRDLCLLGYYQDPRTWPALGYDGPMVHRSDDRGRPARAPGPYDALRAPDGALPDGVVP